MKRLLDTEVKFYDQDSPQVPKILSSWGSLIDYLDCVLVTGTIGIPVTSIETYEDPDYPTEFWLSKISFEEITGFKENLSVVEITGCEEIFYNTISRVQEVGKNYVIIAYDKILYPFQPPNIQQTVGTLLKLPSLGFDKVFEEHQKAIYKVSTKKEKYAYLRVDNSCPTGHDPSHLKFARVSMFSEIDGIDDYRFRLGRQKAPAYTGDYNRAEEYIYDIWFHCQYSSSDMNINGTSGRNLDKYSLIGDQGTFYLTMDYLRSNSSYPADITYLFGEYEKLTFKEDPLPFILFTSERMSYTSPVFMQYNYYENLTRDRNQGKHTFKTDSEDIFTSSTSDRWAPWLGDGYHSGANTKVSFKPYKNEIQLNMCDATLRFFRVENTVLEGRYRGIKFYINNLQDQENFAPSFKTPYFYNNKFYIRISDRDYSEKASFAIQLDNWE